MEYFENQQKFIEYLKVVDVEKPFDCPDLRVLFEGVTFKHHIAGERKYNLDSLMCIKSAEVEQSAMSHHNCGISGEPRLNSKGELEIYCKWGLGFKITLK